MPVLKDFLRIQADMAVASGEYLLQKAKGRGLAARARRGEGRPVLLLPGFKAGDGSMMPLREFLRAAGFDAHTWGLGRNEGFPGPSGEATVEQMTDRLAARIEELKLNSGRNVALVGHSLGGLYARETAARYPEHVDRVVTLGSPTMHPYISDDQNQFVIALAQRGKPARSRVSVTGKRGFLHWGARQPALPCVSIWSPIDAIVFTQSARIPDYIVQLSEAPAIRENVRIVCSQAGMAVNEAAMLAVADRLVEPVENWQPFDARDYFTERQIERVERAFGNRLFHDFVSADWREQPVERKLVEQDQPALLRQLRQDHADFLQLYRMLEESFQGEFGAESDYLLLSDVARFLTEYLDARHHPLEEFIFEAVVRRDPDSAQTLQRLEAEHQRVEKEGVGLRRAIERASPEDNETQRRKLHARWRRFCKLLKGHVEMEEQQLLPLAAKVVPERVWRQLCDRWSRDQEELENPLSTTSEGRDFQALFEYLTYVSSRDCKTRPYGDNSLSGLYLDSLVAAGERVERALPSTEG